jgi:hypothetical protein
LRLGLEVTVGGVELATTQPEQPCYSAYGYILWVRMVELLLKELQLRGHVAGKIAACGHGSLVHFLKGPEVTKPLLGASGDS